MPKPLSKAIQKNKHSSLASLMSGYQKSKNKKEYAKSIILITPLDRNKRIIFEKSPEEVTPED